MMHRYYLHISIVKLLIAGFLSLFLSCAAVPVGNKYQSLIDSDARTQLKTARDIHEAYVVRGLSTNPEWDKAWVIIYDNILKSEWIKER